MLLPVKFGDGGEGEGGGGGGGGGGRFEKNVRTSGKILAMPLISVSNHSSMY